MSKDSFLFTSFLGAIKDSLTQEGYTAQQANHLLVAHLMEIVNDTVHENGSIDHYVLTPVYRFLVNLQTEENRSLQEEAYLPQVQQKMAANEYFINFLSKELAAIKSNQKEEP